MRFVPVQNKMLKISEKEKNNVRVLRLARVDDNLY